MNKNSSPQPTIAKDPIVIYYWPTRGIVQPILYLLKYLEIPYTWEKITNSDNYFNSKSSLAHKGLKFPNLPYIEDGPLKKSESYAIMAYLAHRDDRHDILPNVATFGKVLCMKELVDTLSKGFTKLNYSSHSICEMKEMYKSYLEEHKIIISGLIQTLQEHSWLVSDTINIVDFKFAYLVEKLLKFEHDTGIHNVSNTVEFTNYWHHFERLPNVRDFIKETTVDTSLAYFSSDATWGG